MSEGVVRPSGHATFEILRKRSWVPEKLDARLRAYRPRTHLGDLVRDCFEHLPTWLALELLDEMKIVLVGESSLHVQVLRLGGWLEDWGVVSRKVITDAAVARMIDAFQGLDVVTGWNFHGLGTGTNAEQVADTALQTELTTQYTTDNTRPAGVLTEGAPNQLRSQATIGVDASVTIQEHGIFSQAAAPGGVLLDRSLTGGQSLTSGESLIVTHTISIASGG